MEEDTLAFLNDTNTTFNPEQIEFHNMPIVTYFSYSIIILLPSLICNCEMLKVIKYYKNDEEEQDDEDYYN